MENILKIINYLSEQHTLFKEKPFSRQLKTQDVESAYLIQQGY